MNEEMNNNNYEKNNSGVKVLLIILIILVLCLIGLTCYKMFIYDKKNDNKKDNDVVENNNKNGNKIEIYYDTDDSKDEYKMQSRYSNKKLEYLYKKVGSIVCNSACEFMFADKNYVVVFENNSYSIYNYVENKLFKTNLFSNLIEPVIDIIVDKNENIKAITATVFDDTSEKSASKMYIYNFDSNELIEIDGVEDWKNAITIVDYSKYKTLYDYNLIETNLGVYNYKTGEKIIDFERGIFVYNDNIYLYDDNGLYDVRNHKYVIKQKNIKFVYEVNDKIVVIYNNKFETYNNKFEKILESKKYDEILSYKKEYILALNLKKLEIIDINDRKIVQLDDYTNVKNIYDDTLVEIAYPSPGFDDKKLSEYEISFTIKTRKVTYEELKNNPKITSEDLNFFKSIKNDIDWQYGYQYIFNTNTGQVQKNAIIVHS